METRANYVAVGAFVLALLAGVVIAVLWLASVEFSRQFAFYDVFFTGSVAGLTQGSSVQYNGIQVGRVREIRIDPQNVQQVRVTIEVDQGTVIKSDAVASLEVQGLTGVAFIEITGGSQNAPPVAAHAGERYPVIASQPSGLQRLAASAPEALARLIDVAERVAAVLDDKNRAAIGETLDNVRRLSAVAGARAGDLDSAMGDAAAAIREFRGAVAAAHQTLLDFDDLVGGKGDARETLRAIAEASRRLDQLSAHVDAMVQEDRRPLHDFSERGLTELSQLLVDARTLVVSLNHIAEDLQRDPERFFFRNRQQGYQPR
jgi:phospholipid/cholesterol/gamma-HCH transport system substrate-binding protein